MSCAGRAVFIAGVFMVWMQGCLAASLTEGSGAFATLKSEKGTLSQTWAYLADQEGSGDSEASQFSSSSGKFPIYFQTSSMEPSLEEALSSSIYYVQNSDTDTAGDSDIVFVDSDSDVEESIPEDTTMVDSDIYELDREDNNIGEGVEEESGADQEGDTDGENEILDVTPTEVESVTSPHDEEDGNVINPNNVRHSPEDHSGNNNDLNIVSSDHGNEFVGNRGHADGMEKDAEGKGGSGLLSGVPGSEVMALVMFGGALGVGVLLSFLLVSLAKYGRKIFRRKPEEP